MRTAAVLIQAGLASGQASAPDADDLERAAGAARTAENVAGAVSQTADRAFALIEGLPFEAHAIMGAALVSGLLLWLWGRALLKPAAGLLGVAAGAFTGLFLAPAFGVDAVFGVPVWVICMVAGGALGLSIALLALRIAVVGLSSVAFGLAGLMIAVAVVETPRPPGASETAAAEVGAVESGGAEGVDPEGLSPRERVRRDIEALGLRLQSRPGERPEAIEPGAAAPADTRSEFDVVLDHVGEVVTTAWDYVRASFLSISPADRAMVAGSTLAGLGLGVVFGVVLPRRSSALVTALAGSAMWLTATVWLAQLAPARYDAARAVVEHDPKSWAVIWPVVALIGLSLQLTGRRRRRRRLRRRELAER